MTAAEADYIFTNNWFDAHKAAWSQLLNQLNPGRILEGGSYEGKSVEIHCIDSWEGGIEHRTGGSAATDMTEVEARFHHNIKTARRRASHEATITIHKWLKQHTATQAPRRRQAGLL